MITFTYPDNMKNGQLERLLTAIEAVFTGRNLGLPTIKIFREAIEEHGDRAIHELIGSYFASWCGTVGRNDPPSEDCYKSRAMKYLAEQDEDAAVRELHDFRWNTSHYHGKVATRCDLCGRLRHGVKWKKGKPTLEGWVEMEETCPACERQEEYRSPNPDPTERDMKAWLAESS